MTRPTTSMSGSDTLASRRERRQAARDAAHLTPDGRRPAAATTSRGRTLAFLGVVAIVLAVGAALAFGDFFDRPSGNGPVTGVIDVQSSMAGFTPTPIRVKAGETVTLSWWTDDAAVHLKDGVHTMIAPDLGLSEALPAESRRAIVWKVPDRPGTYDVYCDTCCGGKDAPQMHGEIIIEPAA